jgi:hypothetical protein
MAKNPQIIDHKNNRLHKLGNDWSSIDYDNRTAIMKGSKAIMGLKCFERHYGKTYKHWFAIATEAQMNLICAKNVYADCENLFVLHLQISNELSGARTGAETSATMNNPGSGQA